MPRATASFDTFQAVADPTRRAILDRLSNGSCAVVELTAGFAITRPAVSRHLRVLREASIVECKKDGRRQIYQLRPDRLRNIALWIESYRRFWEINLISLKAHLEKTP